MDSLFADRTIADDTIRESIDHAATILSDFMGFTIKVDTYHFAAPMEQLLAYDKKETIIQHLCTELKGELKGSSFWGLSLENMECVQNTAAQKLGMPTPVDDTEMKEAIMLEVDNIISAAMITKLANKTQLNIYGDVPKIMSKPVDIIYSPLFAETQPLAVATNLVGVNNNFRATFHWIFTV